MEEEKRIEDLSVKELIEQIKLKSEEGRKYKLSELVYYLLEKANNFTSLLINDLILEDRLCDLTFLFFYDRKLVIRIIKSIDNLYLETKHGLTC